MTAQQHGSLGRHILLRLVGGNANVVFAPADFFEKEMGFEVEMVSHLVLKWRRRGRQGR